MVRYLPRANDENQPVIGQDGRIRYEKSDTSGPGFITSGKQILNPNSSSSSSKNKGRVWPWVAAAVIGGILVSGVSITKIKPAIDETASTVGNGTRAACQKYLSALCGGGGSSKMTNEIVSKAAFPIKSSDGKVEMTEGLFTYVIPPTTKKNPTFVAQPKKDANGKVVSIANIGVRVQVEYTDPAGFETLTGQKPAAVTPQRYFGSLANYSDPKYKKVMKKALCADLDNIIEAAQANADELAGSKKEASIIKAGENANTVLETKDNDPSKPDIYVTYDLDPKSTKEASPVVTCTQ